MIVCRMPGSLRLGDALERYPCACSLQDRKLMAQNYEFQQQIKALAEPRPHCRKPSKDQSRHELQAIRQCPNDIVLRRIVV